MSEPVIWVPESGCVDEVAGAGFEFMTILNQQFNVPVDAGNLFRAHGTIGGYKLWQFRPIVRPLQ